MATTTSRRVLDFQDWPAVIEDVERLRRDGYTKAGRWDLAQTCAHLADWMAYTVDGFPTPSALIKLMLWTLRKSAGKMLLRRTLTTRSMPSGGPTMPATVHPPGANEAKAVERLLSTIARFQAHPGRFHPSPIFGEPDRESWNQLQLIHCAHHLSFLIPPAVN